MRTVLPIVALGLVACGKDSDATDDTADLGCQVEVRATYPAADTIDFYYKGIVEFQLNKADETAEITMDGVEGTSWRNDRNDIVYFEPAEDLAPSTEYTATLSYCTGEPSITFTTSALGEPVDSSVDLTSFTYSLDLQTGRVVIPEGVGAVLQDYLDFQILVQPTSVTETGIEITGALQMRTPIRPISPTAIPPLPLTRPTSRLRLTSSLAPRRPPSTWPTSR